MNKANFIPVYQPSLNGNEKTYVNQCLDTGWISSRGEFVNRFEKEFAQYVGISHAASVSNGTVALHVALVALGIKPGDEIIVPTLTYVASVNTIIQAGAKPVFVDSVYETWQMDPKDVEQKITGNTRAIMVVHLYGHSCDMSALVEICKKHNLLMIEDCAEALGTFYKDQHVGTFGDVATFSFFGNKTITTGEGGMVVTKNPEFHESVVRLKGQGVSPTRTYWHERIGFNYRMTNICAAIGVAQLEQMDVFLEKKRQVALFYQESLNDLPVIMHSEPPMTKHSYWMCSLLVKDAKHRDSLRDYLNVQLIETRPLFFPVHTMPIYESLQEKHPVAELLSAQGMNLPSWPDLTKEQLTRIAGVIRQYFAEHA